MRAFRLLAAAALLGAVSLPASAQETTQPAPAQRREKPAEPPAAAAEELPPPLPVGSLIEMPFVELQALDKITARVQSIRAPVGKVIQFGALNLSIDSCRKAPPEEPREAAAFLRIWEAKPGEKSQWVFSGWMFASSPALSAMDHAVYDIWVKDCSGAATSATVPEETAPAAKPAAPAAAAPKPAVPRKP
jgi:hypothetical protein